MDDPFTPSFLELYSTEMCYTTYFPALGQHSSMTCQCKCLSTRLIKIMIASASTASSGTTMNHCVKKKKNPLKFPLKLVPLVPLPLKIGK